MTLSIRIIPLGTLLILSSLCGQRFHPFPRFEVGGGANLTMPRQTYDNGWGIGLDGVWNFSPRYGLNLAYGTTKVKTKMANNDKTITSFVGGIEISFRRGDYVRGFTSISLGDVSGEENTLFIFGIGIKIPIHNHYLIRLELRDFFTEIGIPFFSFPGGQAALQGLGTSKYLELGLGIAYTFDKKGRAVRELPIFRRKPWKS